MVAGRSSKARVAVGKSVPGAPSTDRKHNYAKSKTSEEAVPILSVTLSTISTQSVKKPSGESFFYSKVEGPMGIHQRLCRLVNVS